MVLLGTGGALAGGHIVTQAEKLGIYAGMPLLGARYTYMVQGLLCLACLAFVLWLP